MSKKGKIASWNSRKGYGFISPTNGGERVFVHIKAFSGRRHKPVVGQSITYALRAGAGAGESTVGIRQGSLESA